MSKTSIRRIATVVAGLLLVESSARALQRGGGGGGGTRSSARTSVNSNQGGNRNTNVNQNANVNRNTNINSNNNVNVNRNVNVDVDNNGRYGSGCCYHDNPLAAAAAVTAVTTATAAVVGAIFSPAQMPPSCVSTVVNGIAYQQCGSTWYQPQYAGDSVSYVVVPQP